MSPDGITRANAGSFVHVAGSNSFSGVIVRRKSVVSETSTGTTATSAATTNRQRLIRAFTVGYMERKSVYTTGTGTFRICALVRPPFQDRRNPHLAEVCFPE